MSTSGTFNFNPSLGELTLFSFMLAGVKSSALVAEHMFSSRMCANMMLSDWSNKGVNLWAVDLQTVPLVQGTATYSVPPETVMILDGYMTTVNGTVNIDRPILPVSRTEYSTYPNKAQQGFSTVYWFDRLISPTVTLWPVPDGTSASYFKYYRVRQVQDSNFTSAQNVEIPYRWLNAFSTGLGFRLSMIWSQDKPQLIAGLKGFADEGYNAAAWQDVEQAQQYFVPQIGGYFRP